MKWECQGTVWLARGCMKEACHFDEIHRPLEGSSNPLVLATIQEVSMYFMTIRGTRDLPWEGDKADSQAWPLHPPSLALSVRCTGPSSQFAHLSS